jgi:hypothetical protein
MTLERLLLALVLAAALVGAGYWWGDHAATNACEAAKTKVITKAVAIKEKKQAAGRKVAQAYEQDRAELEKTFDSLEKRGDANEAQNPAYDRCGLDADGLRIWRDANDGIESDAGTSAHDGSGAPATTGLGQPAGPVEESPRGGEDVPPAGEAVPAPGGVDQQNERSE